MRVQLEYGHRFLHLTVPDHTDVLSMRHRSALSDPLAVIRRALARPIGGATLAQQVATLRRAGRKAAEITVAVTVSDNTRPVPYSAARQDGILMPLLDALRAAGIRAENVTIVIGTGTHAATSREWKRAALGEEVVGRCRIVDHDCTSPTLRSIGLVEGVEVRVDERFLSADLRIATGLAEPHFMAGVSGGAKAICPGLINLETTQRFHGAAWMDDPRATSLNLEGNPCYRFSREVARRVGVHFSVNCLVDREGRLTGVCAGDLEEAHAEAARAVRRAAAIPCAHEYDIVLTHGGKVAVNHYQAAKAACAAMPVTAAGGILILAACNEDPEPIGKPEYRSLLGLLKDKGVGRFSEHIKNPAWWFVPDQWEVQKWDQFFRKLGGFANLIYCTTGIPADALARLPGRSGYEFVSETHGADPERMVQEAITATVRQKGAELGRPPRVAVLADGPSGVPILAP